MKRAIERSKLDRETNIELVETMWNQFSNLGIYELNVIDTTTHSIKDTVSAVKDAHRGSKGRDGGSGRAAKENGTAQRDGSAQGTGADGGKHPSAVTGAVHEEAAGRSAAAAEA